MKENLSTVQLRSSIFLQQNIGYTPENADRIKGLLNINEGKVYGIPQPGLPVLGVNPMMPQYGMPWRIFIKKDDGREYNIAFQPGKIDIVLAKEESYNSNIETAFCQQSVEWFSSILDTLNGLTVQRIAYAPLYAIPKGNAGANLWKNLLNKTFIDGVQAQDINLQFLLKKLVSFGGMEIQMNLLHQIFDGVQTRMVNDTQTVCEVLLLQLDLNSVPEKVLSLDKAGITAFFSGILGVKNSLIDNVEA